MIASILGWFPWYVWALGAGGLIVAAMFLPAFAVFAKAANALLGVVPALVWAILLVFALGAAGVERSLLVSLKAEVKADKQAQIAKDAQAKVDAANAISVALKSAAEETSKLQKEQNVRIQKANQVTVKAVVDSRNLRDTVAGLRDTIYTLDTANMPNTTAAKYRTDAAIARGLLNECSSEYSKVAEQAVGYYADSLRN